MQPNGTAPAKRYAAQGYAVFAVKRGGKAPATRNGLKDATTDATQIASWAAHHNVGLLPPERVLVLDADSPEEVERLEREHPTLATAPRCDTPSGGAHLYTRLPEGVTPPPASTKVQGRKLDIRGLARAYLVAPPSTLPTGAYRWARPLVSPGELPETPAGVLELLSSPKPATKPSAAPKQDAPPKGDHARRYALAALQREHDNVASAAEGSRNDALNRAAYSLGQLVGAGALERAEVEDALRAAASTCGLDEREVEATISSGLEAGVREPREIPEPKSTNNRFKARDDAAAGHRVARPEIVVNNRWLRDISDDAKDALLAANDPPALYLRGTIPARVNGEKIEALTNTTLKGHLDRIADFVKLTYEPGENGGEPVPVTTPARPPADLAPDLLGRLDLGLPELDEVVNAPVFLPGGGLLAEDGYNAEHRLLLKLRGLSGLRADMPVDEALARLEEVYGDFPFVEQAGRAHVLAMTLQPFLRPMIQGATPMYLIDAPARGTGKGLLAEVCNLIPLGYFAPTMSQPRDSDEAEKRITSVLLEARPIVFLDNVTRLGSDPLHAVLTSQTWQGRILGRSETVTVPNRAVWLASGNNVELTDEMTRRIIPIRLDAGVERPEERTGFRIPDLPEYVRAHRSELVSACLSLVQAWVDAGMPTGEATLGRYESWAGVMGGVLGVSGVSGFLGGRERLHSQADKETQEWVSLLGAWWSAYGERAVTGSEVFGVVKEHKLLLDLWGGRSDLAASQRFGRALAKKCDRVFGAHKIVSAGRDAITKSNAYRLAGPKKTPETPLNPVNTVTDANPSGGFVRGLKSETPVTPVKPPANPVGTNGVQDGISGAGAGVTGVSGVSNRPAAKDDADPWEGIDL